MSRLKKALEQSSFVITSEIAPPKGVDMYDFIQNAQIIKERVIAINVTDNQRSMMRLSSLIACHFLLKEGIEPIYQLACRDRNRLALQSDLLGAAALKIENVLPLTGDPVKSGDQKESKAVFDLNSVKLMELIKKLNAGFAYNDKPLAGATDFFVGGAVDPNRFGSDGFKFKFEQKIEQGARFFQSQPVYDLTQVEAFYKYSQQLKVKSLIGVILIKSAKQAKFLNTIPGIKIPEKVIAKFVDAPEPLQVGIDYAAWEIQQLKPICDGVHIMTVGREDLVPEILNRAGL